MRHRSTWLQRRYDALLEHTVAPLLAGGMMRLGRPLRPAYATFFIATSPSKPRVEELISEALKGVLCEFTPGDWPQSLSEGALVMTMALHNMLAASDERLDNLFRSRGRDTYLAWSSALLSSAPTITSEHDVLTRFAVCESLAAVRRRDVTVSSWLSSHTYSGRTVATGAWTRPRFGKQTESQVGVDILLGTPQLAELAAQLHALSPLSLWQGAVTGTPGAVVSLTPDMVSVLDSPRLRSIINRQIGGQLTHCAQILRPHLPPDATTPQFLHSSLAHFCAEVVASTLAGRSDEGERGGGDLANLVETPSSAALLSIGAKVLSHHQERFGVDFLRQTSNGRWLVERLMINE